MQIERYGSYTFQYTQDVDSPGKVRIYVLSCPSFRGRDTSPVVTHLDPAMGRAPPRICVKPGFKPSTLAAAQRLAHDWADRTDRYIETGVSISKQIAAE